MSESKGQVGRKTKYNKSFIRQAVKLAREHGYTSRQLADFFDVAHSTFYEWMGKHKEFSDSIKSAKQAFDKENIEVALVKAATGYEVQELHVEEYRDDKGKKQLKKKVITKQVPPNVSAVRYWLGNRAPEEWRNKTEHVVLGEPVFIDPNLPPEEASLIYTEMIEGKGQ